MNRNTKTPRIRPVQAWRGEQLTIDMGRTIEGDITCWMKRSPNDQEYRAFNVEDGRFLVLPKEKADDYVVEGVVVSKIAGKWFFDVELDRNDGEGARTIYQGEIIFYDDITGSLGAEGVPPPDFGYNTKSVEVEDVATESREGDKETQQEVNRGTVVHIDLLYDKTDLLAEALSTMSPASMKLVGEATEITDTETVWPFLIETPSSDPSVLDANDDTETVTFIKPLTRYTYLTQFNVVVPADGEADITLRTRKASDDELISERSFKVTGVVGAIVPIPLEPLLFDNQEANFEFYHTIESTDLVELDSSFVTINTNSGGGGGALSEDVPVIGVEMGSIEDGDVLLAGTTMTELTKKMFQVRTFEGYDAPTAGLVTVPSGTLEVGESVVFDLIPSFTQNDAGDFINITYKKNGAPFGILEELTPITNGATIQAGVLTYSVDVSYGQGPIKNDSFGDPHPDGRIEAGTVSASRSITGAFKNWHGSKLDTPPADGGEIRTFTGIYTDSFTLNTGNTNKVHFVAVPATKSLISVIDQDALGADITGSYILSETITTVPDAGGNDITYKVYILTLANAYSSNHRHNIIIG